VVVAHPARSGSHHPVTKGDWEPKRLIILQFDSVEAAKRSLNLPEYAPAKAIRHRTAKSNMVVVEGVG
jgi:uncharacterized protein (DUF1330 family)